MERYTNGLTILITKRNLDIHLSPLHVLAKDPHLSLLVEHVDNRTFYIILHLKILYNQFALQRRNIQ